jgi:formylglycine-generating enzyme
MKNPSCMIVVANAAALILISGCSREKDPPKNVTNGIGMKFVWIPPGKFIMGSPKGEKGRQPDEVQHEVTLTRGFYLGVYAVTQEECLAVMGEGPGDRAGEKNLPLTLSWNHSQEFIKKLRERDEKPYRLPTEAEWEYACRAGTNTPFHFGETISTDQANYDGSGETYGGGKKGVYRGKALPVGGFPANAFGLHDMHGNVLQWCQDWYGDYPQEDVVDPRGPEKGEGRVFRGGAWSPDLGDCRSARRGKQEPDVGFSSFGFRLCFSVE